LKEEGEMEFHYLLLSSIISAIFMTHTDLRSFVSPPSTFTIHRQSHSKPVSISLSGGGKYIKAHT